MLCALRKYESRLALARLLYSRAVDRRVTIVPSPPPPPLFPLPPPPPLPLPLAALPSPLFFSRAGRVAVPRPAAPFSARRRAWRLFRVPCRRSRRAPASVRDGADPDALRGRLQRAGLSAFVRWSTRARSPTRASQTSARPTFTRYGRSESESRTLPELSPRPPASSLTSALRRNASHTSGWSSSLALCAKARAVSPARLATVSFRVRYSESSAAATSRSVARSFGARAASAPGGKRRARWSGGSAAIARRVAATHAASTSGAETGTPARVFAAVATRSSPASAPTTRRSGRARFAFAFAFACASEGELLLLPFFVDGDGNAAEEWSIGTAPPGGPPSGPPSPSRSFLSSGAGVTALGSAVVSDVAFARLAIIVAACAYVTSDARSSGVPHRFEGAVASIAAARRRNACSARRARGGVRARARDRAIHRGRGRGYPALVVRTGRGRERGDGGGEAGGDGVESRGVRARGDVRDGDVVGRDADVEEALEELLARLEIHRGKRAREARSAPGGKSERRPRGVVERSSAPREIRSHDGETADDRRATRV